MSIENGLTPRVVLADETRKTYNLNDRMTLLGVPGVSVAIFDDRHVIWAKGYGSTDSRRLQSVDVHTRFQAASISKSVTAFAVMTLVQSKGLNLDRDVNDYLRTWKVPSSEPNRTEKVTIRRLLSHTAGLNVGGFAG
ncbi:serine hydrolase, partial [Shinella sp. DD12]|uniref:serine hydrolase domain-containing protein n=1 Tax=Shinella sp. DD12 TaxID=1410620 RepID=UPI0018CC7294